VRRNLELGKGTQCNGNICVEDRVIDRSNLVGKVIEVFDSGKAEVQLDGSHSGPSIRDVNELGKGVRCIENLCVDNRIVDRSNLVGKVIEVFDSGKAEVQLDGSHSGPSIRSFEELQVER
jgi:translation initiation factor IF-1